jgi:hypothetical protein
MLMRGVVGAHVDKDAATRAGHQLLAHGSDTRGEHLARAACDRTFSFGITGGGYIGTAKDSMKAGRETESVTCDV